MVDFGYNNNAIRNQKHFKPIANGNVADSRMIALTDEPLPCWKPKKEWKFKCKSWIKKLINCCFSQNITKHKLTAYLMYLCYFFFYLYKYLNRYWANQLDIFFKHINRKGYFYSHKNTSYDISLYVIWLSIPCYPKTWKVERKLREVNVNH